MRCHLVTAVMRVVRRVRLSRREPEEGCDRTLSGPSTLVQPERDFGNRHNIHPDGHDDGLRGPGEASANAADESESKNQACTGALNGAVTAPYAEDARCNRRVPW